MVQFIKKLGSKNEDPEGVFAEAIIDVRHSREAIANVLPLFMTWSVEAAQMGNDAYSDELLEQMAFFGEFVEDLRALETQLKVEGLIAMSLDNIASLAKALKGCTTLFKSGSRLGVEGKNLVEFRKHIGKGMSEVKNIRSQMTRYTPSTTSIFAETKAEETAKVKSLKEERDRLLTKPPTVSEPKSISDEIDLDVLIEEENNKK